MTRAQMVKRLWRYKKIELGWHGWTKIDVAERYGKVSVSAVDKWFADICNPHKSQNALIDADYKEVFG